MFGNFIDGEESQHTTVRENAFDCHFLSFKYVPVVAVVAGFMNGRLNQRMGWGFKGKWGGAYT